MKIDFLKFVMQNYFPAAVNSKNTAAFDRSRLLLFATAAGDVS